MSLKQITLATLALAASIAHAGDYGDAVDKQNRCEREGRMAAESFASDTVFGKTIKEHSAAHKAGEIPKDAFFGILMISINARLSRISNEKDAYMDAWARCMDRK